MSKVYENVIKKNERKIKRIKKPKTIGDNLDNLLLDLANYDNRIVLIEEDVKKLKWYGWQIQNSLSEIVEILRDHRIYNTFVKKEKI